MKHEPLGRAYSGVGLCQHCGRHGRRWCFAPRGESINVWKGYCSVRCYRCPGREGHTCGNRFTYHPQSQHVVIAVEREQS
jgi:hypothetical protein